MEDQVPAQPVILLRKRTMLIIGAVVVVILLLAGFFFFRPRSSGVLATVNDQPVYSSYLAKEEALYPGEKTPDVKKRLTQKAIDDQITLEGAKQQGLIKGYNTNPNPTTQEYLERTDQVKAAKEKINMSANHISGKIVSVWMYNNNYIGPQGLEKGREMAYAKIKPLYDKVKAGEMTIEQAGEAIRNDKSLKEIDPAWEVNALGDFDFYEGKKGTFWSEFDKLLWNTKPGEITPLYLGRGRDQKGVMSDELYIFGQVDEKTTDQDYNGYNEWLEQQKEKANVKLANGSLVPQAFAQDSDGGGNDSNQSSNSSDNGNDNNVQDFHGLAVWRIEVTSPTGALVRGATIDYVNGWKDRATYQAPGGVFGFGPSYSAGCGANPHDFTIHPPAGAARSSASFIPQAWAAAAPTATPSATATPSGTTGPITPGVCGTKRFAPGNFIYEINETVPCGPPGPTPTPVLTCNITCASDIECAKGVDGCTKCLPKAGGTATGSATGKTCQPAPATPTPKPPACNTACATDTECDKAVDGCVWCTAGKCSPRVACGTACKTKADCAGVRDSCTECLPNANGTGSSCKPPPACNTACTKDTDCGGAKNGCNICSEAGKCTSFSPDMCKCDGMDIAAAGGASTFFPGSDVTFIAFAKVEGAQSNIAGVESMTLSLYQSKLSDPNTATRLAKSTAITPEVVSGSAGGTVRYKVTWNQKIPATVPAGSLFRVQADIKCAKKPGILGAQTKQESNYYAAIAQTIQGLVSNTKVLGESIREQQQAETFFPGATISEKSCNIMKFYFK